jgi:hypothetical protein
MGWIAATAGDTSAAIGVDLADDSLSHPLGRTVRVCHDPHKFVAQYTPKPQISTQYLHIGIAYA